MKQAARSPGQQQAEPRPDAPKQRDSGPRVTAPPPLPKQKPASFYQPLPIGSEAFMAPLAPPPQRRVVVPRQLLWLCALGAGAGALAGAIVLAVALRGEEPNAAAVGLGSNRAPKPSAVRAVAAEVAGDLGHAAKQAERVQPQQPLPPAASAVPQPAATAAPAPAPAASAPSAAPTAESEGDPSRAGHERRAERRKEKLLERPSREQVIAAMSRVQGDVRACYGSSHGVATADLTVIGKSGRVTTAHVSGLSGTVGSCIARAVRKAQFPKFSTESISIRYPMAH
jgi:hypothetical protein